MKTRIFAVVVLAVFLATAMVGCSFELSDDDVDYLSMFESDVVSYTFDVKALDVDKVTIDMETYVNNNESDVFYVDNESGYESKCYKYVVITMNADCVLDEVAMYIKWDKADSGTEAEAHLNAQFFKVSSEAEILSAEWIKNALIAIAKGEADESVLVKNDIDARFPLKDGKWNDGVLTSLHGFSMKKGDKFVIKFPQNCDFEYTYDEEAEGEENTKYDFTEKVDNNVSFKLDKLMFHIA